MTIYIKFGGEPVYGDGAIAGIIGPRGFSAWAGMATDINPDTGEPYIDEATVQAMVEYLRNTATTVGRSFPTRAAAIPVLPLMGLADGDMFWAGLQRYRWQTGATYIPDMPNCVPVAPVSPEHWGGVPWFAPVREIDGTITDEALALASPDSSAALVAADLFCAATGQVARPGAGVFGSYNAGFEMRATWEGAGAPSLKPFPIDGDDKIYLRRGYKHLLPGTTLIFCGTGTAIHTTQRTDDYASVTYCVKRSRFGDIKNLGIVLDCDVYRPGPEVDVNGYPLKTTWATDNRAHYDVGSLITVGGVRQDITVFGYFAKAGTAIHAILGQRGGNPDYCVIDGSSMGRHGIALIGSNIDDAYQSGLSGTTINAQMFTLDHHNRGDATDRPNIYANQLDWTPLFIDGRTVALQTDINGTSVFGSLRSYCKAPFKIGAASNIRFFGNVMETPPWSDIPDTITKQIVVTDRTSDISFIDVRLNNDIGLVPASNIMNGEILLIGSYLNNYSGMIRLAKGNFVRLGAGSSTTDPAVQYSRGALSSTTGGWAERMDVSNGDVFEWRYENAVRYRIYPDGGQAYFGLKDGGAKTIADGRIVLGNFNNYGLANEADALTDELYFIDDALAFPGKRVMIYPVKSGRTTTLKHTTEFAHGNFRSRRGDWVASSTWDQMEIVCRGTAQSGYYWVPLNWWPAP